MGEKKGKRRRNSQFSQNVDHSGNQKSMSRSNNHRRHWDVASDEREDPPKQLPRQRWARRPPEPKPLSRQQLPLQLILRNHIDHRTNMIKASLTYQFNFMFVEMLFVCKFCLCTRGGGPSSRILLGSNKWLCITFRAAVVVLPICFCCVYLACVSLFVLCCALLLYCLVYWLRIAV